MSVDKIEVIMQDEGGAVEMGVGVSVMSMAESKKESLKRWKVFAKVLLHFGNVIMFFLVMFFAYFYASIVFNPKDISENLKKQGGFIPGIRPGEGTANFLTDVANKLTFWGALYLAIIATLPWILVKASGVPFYFGGTAVLIVVQVAMDTMRKIEAQIYMNKYKTLSAVGL